MEVEVKVEVEVEVDSRLTVDYVSVGLPAVIRSESYRRMSQHIDITPSRQCPPSSSPWLHNLKHNLVPPKKLSWSIIIPGWYHLFSVLSIIATKLVGDLSMPVTPCWKWDDVPESWESMGHLPTDTTIDLYLELKPQHENAEHVEANDTVLRTLSYSLHDALQGHIQTVVPTTFFGSLRTQWHSPPWGSCGTDEDGVGGARDGTARRKISVTPSYLRWLYKTVGYAPAVDQNAIATAGFAVEYPSPQDLSAFMTEYRTDGEDATFTVTQVNGGGYNPNKPDFQANLGLHAPKEYAESTCEQFPKLGVRGVIVMFSSGDWGAGQGDCLVRSGNRQVSVQFLPEFSASCTLLSVRKRYRDGKSLTTPPHFRSPYGRDIPDISAQALNFEIVIDGEFEEVDGTSGSAPVRLSHLPPSAVVHPRVPSWPPNVQTVAGIISLLNDYCLSKGKHTLGFLNLVISQPLKEALSA
ncbi:hypothetical protein EDB85DRAFT_2276961 [Lactarius pseudohatsudake]|nr:hypothetical protein EDB85DRAFT_2276961 [Lactarius pseudohatsudake]